MDKEKLEAFFSQPEEDEGPRRDILCEYGFSAKGEEVRWTHYGACHASCTPRLGLTLISTSCGCDYFDRDLCRRYYDWLINRSPWAPVFQAGLVIKDIEWMLDFGFVFDWPEGYHGLAKNYIWAAYITTRWQWERPQYASDFFKLVDANPELEENLIFLWVCLHRNHMTPYAANMLDETVRNFVSGKPVKERLDYEHHSGADQIWGPQGDYRTRGVLVDIKTIEGLKKYAEGLDR